MSVYQCGPEGDDGVGVAVSVRGGRKGFAGRAILENLDLTIGYGEFVALLGASGCGKTTLLRILAGLDRFDQGDARVPVARSVVFQEPRLIPSLRVWQNVLLGIRADRAQAEEALSEVGLAARASAWPRTLSGGEAQRVALARALIRSPGLLLLDEPFAALDALTRLRMQNLVAELCIRHQPATLLVTHDVDEAIRLADRVLVLRDRVVRRDLVVDRRRRSSADDPYAAELKQDLLLELGVNGAAAPAPAETVIPERRN